MMMDVCVAQCWRREYEECRALRYEVGSLGFVCRVIAKKVTIKGSRNDAGAGNVAPREGLKGWIGVTF